MATSSCLKITTSGLVFALDAADKLSYTGSGTSWKDLSGNAYNATLTNGPTFTNAFAGNIVFDGTNDYAISTVTGGLGTGDFTLEFWFYKNTDAGMVFNSRSGGTGSDGIDISRNLGTTTSFSVIFSDVTVNTSTWTHVFIGRSSGTMYRYINLSLNGSTAIGNSFTGTTFNIGGNPAGNVGYLNGYMPIVRLYNKFLSLDERSTNYNATRIRFKV